MQVHEARSSTNSPKWDTISKRQHEKHQAAEATKDNAIKKSSLLHGPSYALFQLT